MAWPAPDSPHSSNWQAYSPGNGRHCMPLSPLHYVQKKCFLVSLSVSLDGEFQGRHSKVSQGSGRNYVDCGTTKTKSLRPNLFVARGPDAQHESF